MYAYKQVWPISSPHASDIQEETCLFPTAKKTMTFNKWSSDPSKHKGYLNTVSYPAVGIHMKTNYGRSKLQELV
jgi:hypothetical protein